MTHRRLSLRSALSVLGMILCLTPGAAFAAKPGAEVQIRLNKTEYVLGEPILIRTTVTNLSAADIRFYYSYFGYETRGLGVLVLRDGEPYVDFPKAPIQLDYYRDRYGLGVIPAGESRDRVDMLLVHDPGAYSIQVKIRDKTGTTRESNRQACTVQPLDRCDPVLRFVKPEFVWNLGMTIARKHYWDGMSDTYRRPGPGNPRPPDFEDIAPQIIKHGQKSVFHEYVLYAYLLTHREGRLSGWPLDSPETEAMANDFLQQYPKSWLVPEICRMLFSTYLREQRASEARRVAELALRFDPAGALLRNQGIRTRLRALEGNPQPDSAVPARHEP